MKQAKIILTTILVLVLYCTVASAEIDISRVAYNDINNESVVNNNVDKLSIDICNLYKRTADNFHIQQKHVKIIHLVAGGRAIYTDKNPDIYTDTTSKTLKAPFDIEGATNKYDKESPINCGDKNVKRPNKHFLPDASYNVTDSIVNIMREREKYYESNKDSIFHKLIEEVKEDITFYEALIKYCGADEKQVNSVLETYIKLLTNRDKQDPIIYITEEGKYEFFENHEEIVDIYDNSIKENLAIALSYDDNIISTNNIYDITNKDGNNGCLSIGENSRENLLATALYVAGDIRYVWGAGHMGTNNINGISPIWAEFNKHYKNRNNCLRPSETWCPIHGYAGETLDSCLFGDREVSSIGEYLKLRKNSIAKNNKITRTNLLVTLGKDLKEPLEPHRLEGLDCSGYIGWLFNQIDRTRTYEGTAIEFVRRNEMKEISMYEELLPGDLVAWSSHIVMVIGKVSESNKAYIIVEQVPNTVRTGVLTYKGITEEELEKAKELAYKTNCRLKAELKNEEVKVYNMQGIEYVCDEDGAISRALSIGRLGRDFEDEDKIIEELGMKLKNLKAEQIINYLIDTKIKYS